MGAYRLWSRGSSSPDDEGQARRRAANLASVRVKLLLTLFCATAGRAPYVPHSMAQKQLQDAEERGLDRAAQAGEAGVAEQEADRVCAAHNANPVSLEPRYAGRRAGGHRVPRGRVLGAGRG